MGRRIAFESDRDGDSSPRSYPSGWDFDIFVMNADGSDVRQLTDNEAWGQLANLVLGRRAHRVPVRTGDGDWEIYVMNADGSGVTRLTHNEVDDYFPSWGPATR